MPNIYCQCPVPPFPEIFQPHQNAAPLSPIIRHNPDHCRRSRGTINASQAVRMTTKQPIEILALSLSLSLSPGLSLSLSLSLCLFLLVYLANRESLRNIFSLSVAGTLLVGDDCGKKGIQQKNGICHPFAHPMHTPTHTHQRPDQGVHNMVV